MLHKSKLNVECKKIESQVQTQMTNAKCRIDCAKYNVKWNIEFWRKWNPIAKSAIVSWLLNFRIRMFVKSAIKTIMTFGLSHVKFDL